MMRILSFDQDLGVICAASFLGGMISASSDWHPTLKTIAHVFQGYITTRTIESSSPLSTKVVKAITAAPVGYSTGVLIMKGNIASPEEALVRAIPLFLILFFSIGEVFLNFKRASSVSQWALATLAITLVVFEKKVGITLE